MINVRKATAMGAEKSGVAAGTTRGDTATRVAKRGIASGLVAMGLVAAIGIGAYAVPAAPGGNGSNGSGGGQSGGAPGSNQGGAPGNQGGSSSVNISYTGAAEFSSDTEKSGESYESTTGGQNALLISGGEVELEKVTVNKTGDESDENSDFYGTNAAVLVYNGGKLEIEDSTITTNGGHANAVFAYGTGTIEIKNSEITTSANNSGGIMVTGGGTLTAENLTVETAGNSAAAIRSDRGGGTMTVKGGTYTSNGIGSPAIYSTADVNVTDATLEATVSEGVVIEGSNSVTLENTKVTSTNTKLNGNSETYKNIFIYQSMSGDADEGTGTFTAKNSKLTANKGEQFFVTNTTAVINLENNIYTQESGTFLLAQAGKWGTSGQNGGQVSLSLEDDEVKGDMEFDEISSLELHLGKGSYLRGAMTGGSTKNVKIADEASVWVLEGDVELDFLEDADGTYQNIYSNGHKLTVNGEEVPINTGTPPEHKAGYEEKTDTAAASENKTTDNDNALRWWIIGGISVAVLVAVIAGVIVAVSRKKKSVKKSGKLSEAKPEEKLGEKSDEKSDESGTSSI